MRTPVFILSCVMAPLLSAAEPATLTLTRTIPLPDVKGRFDHLALDVKGRQLFAAALGNNTLEVIDLAAGKRIQSVRRMSKPTGVLYQAEAKRIWVANGDDGTLKILEDAAFEVAGHLGSVPDADNLRFDPQSKLSWLGYGEGALAIVDAGARLIGSVKLAAHPESFQLEKHGNRIFVNVPDAKQIAVIDREKRAVVETWPMEKFLQNFPMALDEARHRLFIGCRKPARLVVVDTATGKIVADLVISGDIDDLFYDATRKRIYASCGEGFIDIVDEHDGGRYVLKERIPTRPGARTALFSSELGELYLAVPQRGNQPAEIRVFQAEK